nr:reverse transcriptase domain-containing protein [Tanacetum cinerariifolium]
AKSPIEEPEYSLSIGYEHLSTTLATELDKVTESNAKNLVPILSEYEVTSDDDTDPRVPLILGRSFLRTGRTLIDVYGEEITLRINDESVTFNLNQVMRYYDNFVNRANVINIAYEEFVQDNTKSSNSTMVSESDFKEPFV